MLLVSFILYFLAIQHLKECSSEIGGCVSDATVDVQQVIAKVKKAQVCLFVFPLIIAPLHGGSGPHLIHASWRPPKSITQTASRWV